MLNIINAVTTAITEATVPTDSRDNAGSSILEADFLRKLERLSLGTDRRLTGRLQGERRSVRRGASVEFADFREYATGDDLRYVDWQAYGRLERLFVKLFVAEEDLSIHLLIDSSESMNFAGEVNGVKGITKFAFARKIAAALGYVGLLRYDRVGVSGFAQGGLGSSSGSYPPGSAYGAGYVRLFARAAAWWTRRLHQCLTGLCPPCRESRCLCGAF